MDRPYVYALIDTRDQSIFYIGKGVGSRVVDHIKGRSHSPLVQDRITAIRESGHEPDIRTLEFDSHEAAFAAEKKLIRYVQATTDTLVNKIAGGGGARRDGASPSDHYREAQRQKSIANWRDPAYRDRVLTSMQKRFSDPAWRAKHKERVEKRFSDPKERARAASVMVATNRSEAVREKRRLQGRKRMDDPDFRAKFLAAAHAANHDPERQARATAKRKAQWADPDEKARRVEAMLRAHAKRWFCVGDARFSRAVDAAVYLGVSVATVYNRVRAGGIRVEDRNTAD